MRATLRTAAEEPLLWFEAGERLELPDVSQPVRTDPTDRGAPPVPVSVGRRDPTEENDSFEELITEEVSRGKLLRLVPAPVPARVASAEAVRPAAVPQRLDTSDRLPALPETPEPAPPPSRLDDEMSTGLFEPLQWDEADPYTTGDFPHLPAMAEIVRPVERTAVPEPRVVPEPPPVPRPLSPIGWSAPPEPEPEPEHRRPHLSLVRNAEIDLDEDYAGCRARPLPAPPRPAVAGWDLPLPPLRANAIVPPWFDEARMSTLVVIDPTLVRPRRSALSIALAEGTAWVLGFLLTFLGGAVGATATVLASLTLALLTG